MPNQGRRRYDGILGGKRSLILPVSDYILKLMKNKNYLVSGIKRSKLRKIIIEYNCSHNMQKFGIGYLEVLFHLLEKEYIIDVPKKMRNNTDTFSFNVVKVRERLSKISGDAQSSPKNVCKTAKTTETACEVDNLSGSFENLTMSPKHGSEQIQKDGNKGPSMVYVDQKFGFKLNASKMKKKRSNLNVSCCPRCKMECSPNELKSHELSDECLFMTKYTIKKNAEFWLKNDKAPVSLSGEKIGIKIQVEDEGYSSYKLKLFLEGNKRSIKSTVTLKVQYFPTENSPTQLFLRRTFVLFGNSNVSISENNAQSEEISKETVLERYLEIEEKEVTATSYVVIMKFVRDDNPLPENKSKPIFVMKIVHVRVDNDLTRDDINTILIEKKTSGMSKQYLTNIPNIQDIAAVPKIYKKMPKEVVPLPLFEIPTRFIHFFNNGFQPSATSNNFYMALEKQKLLKHLTGGLHEANYKNYADYFHTLLYLEEHQAICDLKMYSMKNVPVFQAENQLIKITVPGLAENRPSVLKGDTIFFTYEGMTKNKFVSSQGWVHRVLNEDLLIGMSPRFMKIFVNNFKVDVNFGFNRLSIRTEHRALELSADRDYEIIKNVCFPNSCGNLEKNREILNWINPNIENNPEQKKAVQNILNGTSLPSPYIVFGPPGTGKTVTIVEAINQVYRREEKFYILATAPSNSAANLLAERLLTTVPSSEILRLYSISREWSSIPVNLRDCCNFSNEVCFYPSLDEITSYRIIICTLICAGKLVSMGVPLGHFSFIFVDECGHGMEPTALTSISALLKINQGQLVLSGDPRQLGPVIRSPISKILGLGISLLERLMDSNPLYKRKDEKYNPQCITKLVRNFRSHPDILKVPNELFYDNELMACGDEYYINTFCDWDELPEKGFPLIFHGIEGRDQQDAGSPSFFNIAEVNLVVKYVKSVLDSKKFQGRKLKVGDIGIISPYRRQIDKIRQALKRSNMDGITVGSVEEFQGQERKVIIVSTVRSNPLLLKLDKKFRLGFLREPKRFNVAVTRAQGLLIIIGNPNILEHDENWRKLLEFIIKRGGYTGQDFTLNPDAEIYEAVDAEKVKHLVLDSLMKEILEGKKLEALHENRKMELLQEIRQAGFFTDFTSAGPSQLEMEVSPPFVLSEQ